MGKTKRPAIITLLSVVDIIAGAVGLAAAGLWLPLVNWIASWSSYVAQYLSWIQGFGTILLGVLGVISLVVGYSLLKGKSWAYYLTLFGYGFGVLSLFTPGGILGLGIVPIIMMVLLLRHDAQEYCHTKIGWSWG